MEIRELAQITGVADTTIRYYEDIQILPPPARKENGYREYRESDVERLRLVAGLRRLDFSLDDIKEILDLRDRQIAPCDVLLDLLGKKAKDIQHRITELQRLNTQLEDLHTVGEDFPRDDIQGKHCVCHLVSESQ